jgi:Capsule polysaccharide biosynthesis protein
MITSNSIKNIVFFARSYQADLFPLLKSSNYNSIIVTLTKHEKKLIESKGEKVYACFEEKFPSIITQDFSIPDNYLETSFFSDRFLGRKSFEERRDFLSKEIIFWTTILDATNPVAILNELVAIEISEVLHIEVKKRSIKYLAWMTNPMNNYFYWLCNPIHLSLADSIFSAKISDKSIELAKNYIQKVKNGNHKPFYIEPFLNKKKLENLFRSFLGFAKAVVNELNNSLITKGNKFSYEDYVGTSLIFLNKDFNALFRNVYSNIETVSKYDIVFFPLHYEPESSLLYLAEFYSNQATVIENLSKCLKVNQILVVKEHPAQAGMLTTRAYRNLTKRISNLYYLPSSVSSFDIINKSSLIVTISSHLGWEALILGKPVVLMGKMFYDKHPNVNLFQGFEALRHSIRTDNFKIPDDEQTIKYMSHIIEYSHFGTPFLSDNLYKKDNLDLIIKAIEHEVFK